LDLFGDHGYLEAQEVVVSYIFEAYWCSVEIEVEELAEALFSGLGLVDDAQPVVDVSCAIDLLAMQGDVVASLPYDLLMGHGDVAECW